MECAPHLDFCGVASCDTHRCFILWSGILDRLYIACARDSRGTSWFHHDDLLRYPMATGRWAVRSARRGGTRRSQRTLARPLGYAYSLHGAGSWTHGSHVRGGNPSALSYISLSFVTATFIQRVDPDLAACCPVCAGDPLHPIHLCHSDRTAGLCL